MIFSPFFNILSNAADAVAKSYFVNLCVVGSNPTLASMRDSSVGRAIEKSLLAIFALFVLEKNQVP